MSREAPAAVMFTFTDCASSRGFAVTGTGRYEAQDDRFAMQVRVGGEQSGALDYLREGDRVRVTGRLDDEPVEIRWLGRPMRPARRRAHQCFTHSASDTRHTPPRFLRIGRIISTMASNCSASHVVSR